MNSAPSSLSLTPYKLLTFVFLGFTTAVYWWRLDILIPGLYLSSYRATVGDAWMFVPSFILAAGDILMGGYITFASVRSFTKEFTRIRFWQALAIAGFPAFLFSLTYAIFPGHGPIYYLAWVQGPTTAWALPFEILWTLFEILSFAYLLRRLTSVKWKHSLFISSLIVLIYVLAAD